MEMKKIFYEKRRHSIIFKGLALLVFCGACGISKHMELANLLLKRPIEIKNELRLR
jgi:hypothetical protein